MELQIIGYVSGVIGWGNAMVAYKAAIDMLCLTCYICDLISWLL